MVLERSLEKISGLISKGGKALRDYLVTPPSPSLDEKLSRSDMKVAWCTSKNTTAASAICCQREISDDPSVLLEISPKVMLGNTFRGFRHP